MSELFQEAYKMILQKVVLALGLLQPLPPLNVPPPPQPVGFTVTESLYEKELREASYWHTGLATAYYNGKDEMNGELGITANGYDLDNGYIYKGYRILASDKQYSFGTLIDIKLRDGTLIHGIVLDRGGAINGSGRFDIVFSDDASCREFGRQMVTFKIIRKGW